MDEEFEVPVLYNNQLLLFRAKLLILGSYTHKIQVDVYGNEVLFEMDEERNYRGTLTPPTPTLLKKQTFIY